MKSTEELLEGLLEELEEAICSVAYINTAIENIASVISISEFVVTEDTHQLADKLAEQKNSLSNLIAEIKQQIIEVATRPQGERNEGEDDG